MAPPERHRPADARDQVPGRLDVDGVDVAQVLDRELQDGLEPDDAGRVDQVVDPGAGRDEPVAIGVRGQVADERRRAGRRRPAPGRPRCMSAAMTAAPSRSRRMATACPIPLAAPVTIARLPVALMRSLLVVVVEGVVVRPVIGWRPGTGACPRRRRRPATGGPPSGHRRPTSVMSPKSMMYRAPSWKMQLSGHAAGLRLSLPGAIRGQDVDRAAQERGDPQVAVGGDLQAVGDVALGQPGDQLGRLARALAEDPALVRLDPHDGAVGLGHDAIRVGVGDLLEQLAAAVRLQGEEPARVGGRWAGSRPDR